MSEYTVQATNSWPGEPQTWTLVGDYASLHDADQAARQAVRAGGWQEAHLRGPHGGPKKYQQPAYRPTGRIVTVDVGGGHWMLYSESAPADLPQPMDSEIRWEQHTPQPVTGVEIDAIRLRLKTEIKWWGAKLSEEFHTDPKGGLPDWAVGTVVPGDIEDLPEEAPTLPAGS